MVAARELRGVAVIRIPTMTVRAQAEQGGINYGSLRRINSELGIKCEATQRRDVIYSLMYRGTPREISTYLRLYHGWQVSPDAVCRVIRRIKWRMRGYQFALWPESAFVVPAPPMRIVHRRRERKACPWVQLELFNEYRIAA